MSTAHCSVLFTKDPLFTIRGYTGTSKALKRWVLYLQRIHFSSSEDILEIVKQARTNHSLEEWKLSWGTFVTEWHMVKSSSLIHIISPNHPSEHPQRHTYVWKSTLPLKTRKHRNVMAGSRSIFTHKNVTGAVLGQSCHIQALSQENRLPEERQEEICPLSVWFKHWGWIPTGT